MVPKDAHLGLSERHGEIMADATRILELAAEQEGIKMEVSDPLWEVFDAKGSRVASGWMQPGSTPALQLPAVKGHYVVRWTLDSGETVSRKVVRR